MVYYTPGYNCALSELGSFDGKSSAPQTQSQFSSSSQRSVKKPNSLSYVIVRVNDTISQTLSLSSALQEKEEVEEDALTHLYR